MGNVLGCQLHVTRQRERIMPAITRTCPLCEKKDIKYLSAHLKNKHKLLDAKKRSPLLKQSLMPETATSCDERNDVKRKDTVLDESALDAFHEQERVLGDSFKYLEDSILNLHLKAMKTEYSAMGEWRYRLEIRAKLLPLYGMLMHSLETLLEPTPQMKQVDEVASKQADDAPKQADDAPKQAEDAVPTTPKRKRRSDVRHSGGGMDYLKNGLVRCQLCKLTWDGNAQHDCPYIDELL